MKLTAKNYAYIESIARSTDLGQLEQIIERGKWEFIEVGVALRRIRDGRLYLATHDSWEVYCRERWGWGRNYTNKLINSAMTAEELAGLGTHVPTEWQARQLRRLPTNEKRIDALKKAKDARKKNGKDGPISGGDLARAIDEIKGKAPKLRDVSNEKTKRKAEDALAGFGLFPVNQMEVRYWSKGGLHHMAVIVPGNNSVTSEVSSLDLPSYPELIQAADDYQIRHAPKPGKDVEDGEDDES